MEANNEKIRRLFFLFSLVKKAVKFEKIIYGFEAEIFDTFFGTIVFFLKNRKET